MSSLLYLNNPKDVRFQELGDDMFEEATSSEKSSVVEERKSISYWADAMRRFKANKVAMVALVIFALLLVFAFIGPLVVPYSYESQYRNCMKLAPFEYSDAELAEKEALESYDAVFSTQVMEGSTKALTKGDYTLTIDKETYNFTLAKSLGDAMLLYRKGAEPAIVVGKLKKFKDGVFTETEPLEYTIGEKNEKASEIKLIRSVFPHVFGTDSAGRDIMSRSMYGTRVSLIIGIVAALIVLVIGATIGAVAGLCGGMVDFVIMRIIDLIVSVPSTLMILLLQVVIKQPLQTLFDGSQSGFIKALSHLGVGIVSILIVYALLYWVGMARLVRGQVLQLKSMEFITAENVLGASNRRIIFKHLLPNCVGQLVINTCLQVPSAIFTESFLSYLGIGVAAPMASLGSMCSDALQSLASYPYRLLCPAIILSILVLTLNLIGDGLRDALDPRLK